MVATRPHHSNAGSRNTTDRRFSSRPGASQHQQQQAEDAAGTDRPQEGQQRGRAGWGLLLFAGAVVAGGAVYLVKNSLQDYFGRQRHVVQQTSEALQERYLLPRLFDDRQQQVYTLYQPRGTPDFDIVLVHGIGSDIVGGWSNQDGTVFWPLEWLAQDFPSARIIALQYCTSPSDDTHQRNPLPIGERGVQLYQELSNAIGSPRYQRPVIFIAHSLGGLCVKAILAAADQHGDRYGLLERTRGVVFYGTPQQGLGGCRGLALRWLLGPLNGRNWRDLVRSSATVTLHNRFLELTRRHHVGLYCFAEQELFGGHWLLQWCLVPDRLARIDGHGSHLLADSHEGICKPKSKESPGYALLVDFLRRDVGPLTERKIAVVNLNMIAGPRSLNGATLADIERQRLLPPTSPEQIIHLSALPLDSPLRVQSHEPYRWEEWKHAITDLVAQIRYIREHQDPDALIVIVGNAPLPLFFQLGQELTNVALQRVAVVQLDEHNSRFDYYYLDQAPTLRYQERIFAHRDAAEHVRQGLVGRPQSSDLALFIGTKGDPMQTSSFSSEMLALEALVAVPAANSTLAILTPAHTQRLKQETSDFLDNLARAFPQARTYHLVLSGPAVLAFVVGHNYRPRARPAVQCYDYKGDYTPVL